MVQSKAPSVEAYIAEAPPDRAPCLRRLREIALAALPGYIEEMRWGMPVYTRHGEAEVAFASQNQYVALYIMKAGVQARNAGALVGLDTGKGCIRFRRPDRIDFALVEKLLRDTAASAEEPC
jgi:uncharacterized protein YdhG (YjbR/CyaY superfamily)